MSASTVISLQENPTRPATQAEGARYRPKRGEISSSEDALLASEQVDSTVPDGGYGWVIVASGAAILWWSVGTTYAWGVIQEALVEEGLSGPAVLSFVGSLGAALVSVFAIFNAWLVRFVGVRAIGMAGIGFMGGSEILSSFATKNVGALFFTSGFLYGVGASLCFVVISRIPSQYFKAKRGLANGLIFAGSGFGGAAISFSVDRLIQNVGLPWTFRILGLATLATGLPAAWFMKDRVAVPWPGFVEWRLFKSATFNLIFFASAIGTFPLYVPPFFIPLYTKASGLSSSTGAGLVAGFTLASAVGRIMCGLACDRIGAVNTLIVSLILTGISMLAIWPASHTLGPLIIFVLISGAANGGFFSTMPTVVSNVFGSARVSIAMSMTITGWVGGYLMGAPIAGYLLQAYGGADGGLKAYRPAMFYAAAKNITSSACNFPVRDKSEQYSAMSISLGTITVLLVLIRVTFKRFFSTAQTLGPDDKVILGTLALRISCTIINVQGLAAHGLGKDVWTMAPEELITFVKFLYVMEILYLAELSLIKLSLSLFYLFIFPGSIIRRLLWGTAIFNVLFGTAFVVTAIFQCGPISYYWTQYVEHSGGHCVNINVFAWANAAISVAVDIWLIALPLSQVRALNLHWKKKLGVTVMFLTGAFVTIVSILRLRSLIFFANSSNPTWDQWSIAYWSTIEVNVGMICTCLPSLRLILLRVFPQLGSGTRSGRSYGVQSQPQANLSRRLSNKEQHHLSDLESNTESIS
ncbi:putative AC transposase [Purpureocillium lavendulum]|uniref:AC transposase n=1 Tax=Purpureocillium lavendulum TaxID=1247861 RepID=A0AB34FGF4_9HYPO|nr:putative AC transposase [Purpureocillium lavendulum]